MKKAKETLTVIGFSKDDGYGGVIRFSPVDRYEPFEKKGKLGVRYKDNKRIVIEPEYTYVEAIVSNLDVFFLVGNEGKYGLYDSHSVEIIPVQYEQIDRISSAPKIFWAYTDIGKHHGDVYWRKGLLAQGCKECPVRDFYVKVKYIDDEQELFYFIGDYETEIIIGKGNYNILTHKDHIIVDDGKPAVYNYQGYKVSEDVSGKYVKYSYYLVHVTETGKKFYDGYGKEVDLYKTYEDLVMADEYVLIKHNGHWQFVYNV